MADTPQRYKKLLVLTAIPLLLGLVGFAFYYQDWKYSLPAPKPAQYQAVPVGSVVKPAEVSQIPTLYHFSGTGCPCSEFVITHLRSLAKKHQGKVRFVFVEETIDDEMPDGLPKALEGLATHQIDEGGKLAKKLGVYATPVAALVDGYGKLYFSGNYNRSRYCVDPATEYVRMALDSLMAGKSKANLEAPPAKGCAIFEGIETIALESE